MKVAVTGATGLIGQALSRSLLEDGNRVRALVRDPQTAASKLPGVELFRWAANSTIDPVAFDGFDAVVNLAGESIAGGRWTKQRKQSIRESRVRGTRHVVEALSRCKIRPNVLIQSSAVGFYGDRGDEVLDERSSEGQGFLADLSLEWEGEARRAEDLGLRVVLVRTGIVLSTDGGALAEMLTPFRWSVGGPLGSGKQWMSWIHLDDEVRLIRFALEDEAISGPLVATAPAPVTNREFSRALGRTLKRPAFLPVPGFVLRLLLGEMAQSLLLEGQRVVPNKAQKAGFKFRFEKLEAALQDLLK